MWICILYIKVSSLKYQVLLVTQCMNIVQIFSWTQIFQVLRLNIRNAELSFS